MNRTCCVVALLALGAGPVRAGDGRSGAIICDLTGRELGRIAMDGVAAPRLQPLYTPSITAPDGHSLVLPSGFYMVRPQDAAGGAIAPVRGSPFRFVDVTAALLPPQAWDASDIDTADLTGDGRVDIMFSRLASCQDLPGRSPRLWVQTETGAFVDETAARIPPVPAATYDLELFDGDGDGDTDVFLGGYDCTTSYAPAFLLINNGAGVFTDESSARLPAVSGFQFVHFAEHAPLDGNTSEDLAVVLFGLGVDTNSHLVTAPKLWLNNGSGFFSQGERQRLPPAEYGYLEVRALDVDRDSLQDLVFGSMAYVVTGPGGPDPIDTMSGQLSCYRNAGDGYFVEETATRLPAEDTCSTRTLACADVDRDGYQEILDVRFLGEDHQVRLLRNTGGSFVAATPGISSGVTGWFNAAVFGTLDGDLLPDLFLTKVQIGVSDRDILLLNTGGWTFADSSLLLPDVEDFSVGAALVDHERDGDTDILTANAGPTQGMPGIQRLYRSTLHDPSDVADDDGRIGGVTLLGNYPNPFNPSTRVRFSLPEASGVELELFDVLGRRVRRHAAERLPAGEHDMVVDAASLPSGVYFYRLGAVGVLRVGRMVLER